MSRKAIENAWFSRLCVERLPFPDERTDGCKAIGNASFSRPFRVQARVCVAKRSKTLHFFDLLGRWVCTRAQKAIGDALFSRRPLEVQSDRRRVVSLRQVVVDQKRSRTLRFFDQTVVGSQSDRRRFVSSTRVQLSCDTRKAIEDALFSRRHLHPAAKAIENALFSRHGVHVPERSKALRTFDDVD
jgi:hypothetical protein